MKFSILFSAAMLLGAGTASAHDRLIGGVSASAEVRDYGPGYAINYRQPAYGRDGFSQQEYVRYRHSRHYRDHGRGHGRRHHQDQRRSDYRPSRRAHRDCHRSRSGRMICEW